METVQDLKEYIVRALKVTITNTPVNHSNHLGAIQELHYLIQAEENKNNANN